MGWMVWGLNHSNGRTAASSPKCPEWVGHVVDNSPACSTEVKNDWSCKSASCIHLHGMDRDSVTFTMIWYPSRLLGLQNTMKLFHVPVLLSCLICKSV